MNAQTKAWIPATACYLGILALSSIPGPNLPDTGITFADKPAHFAVYAILGFLLARTGHRFALLLVLGVLLGGLDEFRQSFTPGREPDLWDLVADSIGIAAGLGLHALLNRRRAPSNR